VFRLLDPLSLLPRNASPGRVNGITPVWLIIYMITTSLSGRLTFRLTAICNKQMERLKVHDLAKADGIFPIAITEKYDLLILRF
jgi:hypothetical protein